MDPVKGDIGVILLQYPIRVGGIPLYHTYNIFWKSCYNCQYRHCRVYQYQNHNIFGTSIKKLSVQLLDLSFCHHQHIHLTKSNNLCIWSQPQGDCWVQQGSPVLCLCGNHWELVGLVSESSMACYDPVLVIKTAPYLSWVKWLIKTSQKPLDPIFSLPCNFTPGVEHRPQDRLSLSRGTAILTSHRLSVQSRKRRLGTFPLNRQHRNPPPVFFHLNNRDSFPGSRQLHLQASQLSSTSKFPMIQSWTSLVTKQRDPSDISEPWNTPIAGTSETLVLSGPPKTPTPDKSIPWGLPQKDTMKYQYQTMTNSVNPWVNPLAGIIGLHTLPLVSSAISWVLFSSGIDGSHLLSGVNTVQFQVQSSKVPFHGQLLARPWLEITPDIGPWTHSVPDKTGTVMQIQSSEENIGSQIHHVVDRVHTAFKPVTYNLNAWVPLTVNKNEFWTHSTLNADGSQYPTLTLTLEPWFQSVLNLDGSQELTEKTNEYWILPESKSAQLWTSSALNMPFTWIPSASNTIKSWAQYNTSLSKASSQMERISPWSKRESFMVKPQIQTADTTWFLTHTITNVIKPFFQSKADTTRPWSKPEAAITQTWTQPETQARKPLTQLKAEIRPWLQTKTERIRRWIQPKFQIVRPRAQTENGKDKHWTQSEAHIIRSVTHTEIETFRLGNKPKAGTARSWFWTQSNQMRARSQPDLQTLYPWTQPEVDIVRPWTQSKASSIQPWMKPEALTFRIWSQSKVNTITPWTGPEADVARLWLQIQTNTFRTWSPLESQTNISWSELEADRVRSWLYTQMHTFKPWIETEFQTAHSWTQPEGDIARLWTKSEADNVRHWFQTQVETPTMWTEPVSQVVHHWIQSKTEIVRPWNQPVADKLRAWIQHDIYTVRPWDELEGDKVRFWTQSESDISLGFSQMWV
ncbi:uncharacterized protein LOC118356657 [Zalophus californianus]|uniref:Uncharacterized protein LOC118356657 n=1 Tax=Zalophus californianus TaxID=9704 RepID=A0A6P9FJF9_ZALCA|nr:uncharacterized protein LOC118356657 [Zalophus californianus]